MVVEVYSRPRQLQPAGVLEVMHPEDPVQSCDKCDGREDVPLEYSSGDVEWLRECHRAIGVSGALYSGGCREDSLHDATHLSTDSCLCEGLVQEHLNLRVLIIMNNLRAQTLPLQPRAGRVIFFYACSGQRFRLRFRFQSPRSRLRFRLHQN